MYDLEICRGIKIDTANGSTSMVTHIGKYRGKVQCAVGMENVIVMKNIKVVAGLVKTGASQESILTIHSNAQQLGLADGDKSRQQSIKNKEKQLRMQIQ